MGTTKSQFIVIQKFMLDELHLKGNELIVYAIIYGFSQDGETRFKGSQEYIANWCGISVRQVRTILNTLEEKGLINKIEYITNKAKYNSYAVVNKEVEEKTSDSSIGNNFLDYGKKLPQVEEKTSDNNIVDNIDYNINNKVAEPRKKFGNYGRVLLTLKQYDKLVEEYGKDFIDNQIQLLDEYIESNNNKNKYQNFNLVLRRSITNNWFKQRPKTNNNSTQFVNTNKTMFNNDRF